MAKKFKCPRPINRLVMHRAKGLSGPFYQGLGGGRCIKTQGNYFSPGGAGSIRPVFHGIYPDSSGEMQGVLFGDGALSVARVSDIWLPDWEGIYRQFLGGEIGYRGGSVSGAPGSRVVYAVDGEDHPYVVRAPQATNLITRSDEFDVWGVGAVTVTADDEISIYGTQSADKVTSNTTMTQGIYFSLVEGSPYKQGEELVFSFYIKLGTMAEADCLFALYDATNGTWIEEQISMVRLNTDSYERQEYAFTYPETSENVRLYAFRNANAVSGSIYLCGAQCESGAAATPIIPTEGSAVTRDADGYEFESANWSDTEGTVYLESDAKFVSEILDGMLLVTGGNLRLTDGVNSQDRPFVEGIEPMGFVYGDGTMKLKYNGAWTAGSAYDGTMLQGALDLFRNGPGAGSIRDIRIWAAADESLIDGLM